MAANNPGSPIPDVPIPDENPPRDACGVFGVYAPNEEVAKLTYYGLYALQHRGQESAGMAVSNGERIMVVKDMGLVSQVFDEPTLNSLHGHLAVGHCRYSTAGSSSWSNSQPTFQGTPEGGMALGHNGNLTNTDELEAWLAEMDQSHGVPHKNQMDSTSDTMILAALFSRLIGHGTLPLAAAQQVLPRLKGAFCLVFCTENTLFAARDPQGIHPLVIGRLENGWVVASETAALDIVGATFIREVEPGELITINAAGLRSATFAPADPKGCIFEYVYMARPDTLINGHRIYTVRQEIGRTLAAECAVEADLVIPTPESGTPSAIGYAEGSGIPYGQGLVKNSYVGRTFIQPSQTIRQLGIRLKLNPIRDVIKGKRLIVVD
ncbi:MAG: amidophosphoribosyltransferase, partial [Propionibacteriaceae bacterium]|nr:amidophosphoribosyltransferase [Propionibacteriaceae bacterium]